ncbi:VWA domain-containing protein [Pseudomonas sp. LA21]|uniref:vWA domain-containing protein n=1 Tax=unclassified Pseudomonas TaxID=196821 RepID=UPI001FB66911|nr:VWA domain-containing protein [Pseudomonas sp. LA21]MCJ1888305.1 VWA domain-containing protein [Pseudomonas sp. LA21]
MTPFFPRLFSSCLMLWTCAGMAGPLSVDSSQGKLVAGKPQTFYLKVAVTVPEDGPEKATQTPLNVALVLDNSGSMQGERIDYARRAALSFVERLQTRDRLALVTFSEQAEVRYPSTQNVDKTKLRAIIGKIRDDAYTALYDGVETGAGQVAEHLSKAQLNRVVLLSDGEANIGPSSPQELAELGRGLAKKGISVTTVGLGESYNEELMMKLAAASDGNHVFARNAAQLEGIFGAEFDDARAVVARDAQFDIQLQPGVEPVRVYGYDSEIKGQDIKVKIPQLRGGQEKYVIVEAKTSPGSAMDKLPLAKVGLAYQSMNGETVKAQVDSQAELVHDEKAAVASANPAVMEKAMLQVGTAQNEQALQAISRGDVAKGKQLLKDNAVMLERNAEILNSKELKSIGEQTRSYEKMASEPVRESELKKSMSQDVYNQKTQKVFKSSASTP